MLDRRSFVAGAGAAGLGLGLGAVDEAAAGAVQFRAAAGRGAARQQDGIWIDSLGGVRLGAEGLEEVRRSGLTMQEITLGSGAATFTYRDALADLATWHGNLARAREHILHVHDTRDIHEAKRSGRLGVMLGFQNATQLERDLDNLDFFYGLGVRQIQLTYNSLNALGAGCTERQDVGLSDFGIAVVRRMNELGMLIDLSHVGYRTTMDGIENSADPVVFSHTNCRALVDNPRCKTDEQIRALAARGGVMGLTTVSFFVSNEPTRATADDFIDHVVHVAELVGVGHVGVGSDSGIGGWRSIYPNEKAFWDRYTAFDYKPELRVAWPPFIEELDHPEAFYVIAERLEKRGFSGAEVQQVLGGNFLRVYGQVLD